MSKASLGALTVLLLAAGVRDAQASDISIGQITISTTLVGNAIEVDVRNVPGGDDFGLFGDSGGNRAFGFNVVDPDAGVSISDLTAGFSFAGSGVTDLGGGLGDFEFVINGPHSATDAALPLHFRVTRTGDFTTDLDLNEPNALGNVFGLHVRDLDGGPGGFVAASSNSDGELPPVVPEPASLLLLGTGLSVVARRLRHGKRRPNDSSRSHS